MSNILDGKKVAQAIQNHVKNEVGELKNNQIDPQLTVILVGENPASKIYVKNKIKACENVGIRSNVVELPVDTTQQTLSYQIAKLNEDENIDGILIQLPLPPQMNAFDILCQIDPRKDADGFHPYNVGLLSLGKALLKPCTPAGIIYLLESYRIPIEGKRVVILGRSDIVGKPMAAMLLQKNATVTVCHSKTQNIGDITSQADILVAAIGKPGYVNRKMVRKGAVVIDVGMNSLTKKDDAVRFFAPDPLRLQTFMEKGSILIGDVDFFDVKDKTEWITPVPGGVGPLTVAMLMHNCMVAARIRRKV